MATSNVIPLPTAAKRKVRQLHCGGPDAFDANRNSLPQFPWRRVHKPTRIEEEAALILDTANAEIMQFALAIFSVLDQKQRVKMKGRLIALSALNQTGAKGALAWLNYETASKLEKQAYNLAAMEIAKDRGL